MTERFSFRRRAASFRPAWRGVTGVVRGQHNAWIHLGATVGVVAAGAACGISRLEWGLLGLAIVAVWSAEALNTAIEALGDAVTHERREAIRRAKDMAAGAVLVAAAGAAVVGMLVFGPRLLRLVEALR